jgi:ABC-type nitrate/sulfonate/bicarbonate transport system substrate-binding protein
MRLIAFSKPPALVAAEQQGYFAREDLTVEIELTRGSIEQIRGLLEGRWDVAHTAADNVMAYDDREGADLCVFAVIDLGVGQTLVVRPEVTSFADLRGQPLAVDAIDTGYAFVLRRMLEKNDLPWGTYDLVPVGSTPQRLQALREGRVVGALLSSPPEGLRVLAPAADYFPLYPGLTAAVTRRWARAHQAELVGYTRALLAGARAAEPGAAPLTLQQALASLDVVRQLRQDLTGTTAGLESYVDLSYMERALG